jgi:hypothetical protein
VTLSERIQRAAGRPAVLGFGVFLAVTLAWLGPLLPHFGSAVLERQSDTTNALRMYWAIEQAGESPFTWSHDTLNGAPEGVPRPTAPEFVSPVQSGFVWLVKPLLGRVAALNLFVVLGFLLTGFTTFLLLSRFGFGLPASFLGGYIVAFNPWMFEQAYAGGLAFLHGWVLVLLLWALVRAREVRTLRRAALAGAAYGLCFAFAAYLGLLATALVAAFVLVDLFAQSSAAERLRTLTLALTIGGVTALFLAPGAIAFFLDRSDVTRALTNPLDQLDRLAASPLSYILPSVRHPVFGGLAADLWPEQPLHEKVLYFGLVTLALAVVGALSIRSATGRARHLLTLAAVTAPIALLASLPRSFELAGLRVPTPAYAVGELTSFYRVYARFGYVVGLAAAILAAWAVSRLARTRRGHAVAFAAIAVVVFDLLVGSVRAYRIDVAPDYDRWLAKQPRGIVAHYPMPTDKPEARLLAGNEITFQPLTGQPLYTIFGAGTGGTREDGIRILTRHLDDPLTPGILAAEGVRYVVVHGDVYRAEGDSVPPIPESLELLETFGEVGVYRLRAEPAEVDAELERNATAVALVQGLVPARVETTGSGFNEPEEFRQGELWRWMTQSGRLSITNPNDVASRFRLEGIAFSSESPRELELVDESGRALASVEVPQYAVRLELGPFWLPPGETSLVLRANPGPRPLGTGLRFGSVFFSPLRAMPLPDYSNSLRRG